MNKKKLASMMEWIRPAGIAAVFFLAYAFGHDAVSRFHILGPFVVMLMSGTVAFESVILGEAASEKIGYNVHRSYQIQSGLTHAAIAITALLVYAMNWGPQAESAIVTAMLLAFVFSAANHAATAVLERNVKPVNLLRPILALLLTGFLLPPMIAALSQ